MCILNVRVSWKKEGTDGLLFFILNQNIPDSGLIKTIRNLIAIAFLLNSDLSWGILTLGVEFSQLRFGAIYSFKRAMPPLDT